MEIKPHNVLCFEHLQKYSTVCLSFQNYDNEKAQAQGSPWGEFVCGFLVEHGRSGRGLKRVFVNGGLTANEPVFLHSFRYHQVAEMSAKLWARAEG